MVISFRPVDGPVQENTRRHALTRPTASSVGSNNFPTRVYENPPDLVDWLAGEMVTYGVKPEIEAFDLSHVLKAAEMYKKGQIKGVPYVQFVMGVKNAMPAVDMSSISMCRRSNGYLVTTCLGVRRGSARTKSF